MIHFISRAACPICGKAEGKILVEKSLDTPEISAYLKNYYGGTVPALQGVYRLVQCAACGSLYQREILDDAGMDALYEAWIRAEGSFQKKLTAPLAVRVGYARQTMQIVKAVRKSPHEIRVLDFGMGWGTWLLMVKAFGMQAEGLEVSPSRVAYAQTNGLKVVTPADISPESYDFINAEQVFEHLSDPAAVLQSCHAWLKPRGILRIAVPNGAATPQKIEGGTWSIGEMPTIPLEHINTFTPASLRTFGERNGFRVIHPPLVLPAFGLSLAEVKQFLAVLGGDVASRLGLYQTTVVWLKKR